MKGEAKMKKIATVFVSLASIILFIAVACSGESPNKTAKESSKGEELFKFNCTVCHPNGENVIIKEKSLHKADLDKNGIKTPDDIVKLMRNPGPGMRKFDETTISDHDAHEIAEYVLRTFK
jgi:cytochrome c6